MKNLFQMHPFHLVTNSPWPLIASFNLLTLMLGFIKIFNNKSNLLMMISFISLILTSFQWWRDVIRESFFQGHHTLMVKKGLHLGMMLFIISEIFFFISFFWMHLDSMLFPTPEIGLMWPPKNMIIFNPYYMPLLNTVILLSSGMFITWCHFSIFSNNYIFSIISLCMTVILGMLFTYFQYIEYNQCEFKINDNIYGSTFFMTTGFHGTHVIIGTTFILIMFIRLIKFNFSNKYHFGFEISAWYWHFVDLVWLYLFIMLYWWPF